MPGVCRWFGVMLIAQSLACAQAEPRTVNLEEQAVAAGSPIESGPSLSAASPLSHLARRQNNTTDDQSSSAYLPLDSWVYPELTRLYSLGYLDTIFLGMRPWTRRSVLHALQLSEEPIIADANAEAVEILDALLHELRMEPNLHTRADGVYGVESTYVRVLGIGGPILRDSFHLGQTLVNDFGRPYESGFNSVTGASILAEKRRFSFYVRGEYQHAPAAMGYSAALANELTHIDSIGAITPIAPDTPQSTIPATSIPSQNSFRLLEANVSAHLAGHEISGGKTDAWLGPAQGGSLAWSNNAENIYSFRINRVEPLQLPILSKLLGPVRYDFFYGSLKGHTAPNHPWVHSATFSFRPTQNFEFGFQRTVIFGGAGHTPVTVHTFLKSFFSVSDADFTEKVSRSDPGARFSDFNFSWRLPFLRKYATLYADAIAHDDVTPLSAPRRAAYRTGLEIAQIPGLRSLELRAEAVNTDPPVSRSQYGEFNYWEYIQLQGYTNKGFIMGDWIGREAKGGQAWFTYHLSGKDSVLIEYLNKKTSKDFIPGGTTQNSWTGTLVKRVGQSFEITVYLQVERWKAPIYMPGLNCSLASAFRVTYFPNLRSAVRH